MSRRVPLVLAILVLSGGVAAAQYVYPDPLPLEEGLTLRQTLEVMESNARVVQQPDLPLDGVIRAARIVRFQSLRLPSLTASAGEVTEDTVVALQLQSAQLLDAAFAQDRSRIEEEADEVLRELADLRQLLRLR